MRVFFTNDLGGRVIKATSKSPVHAIDHWVIGAHGDGGREATKIMTDSFPRFEGLVMVGARVDPGFDLKDQFIPVVSVYGGNDHVVTEDHVRFDANNALPDTTYVYGVEGASHATFACYSHPFKSLGADDGLKCDNQGFLDEIKTVIDLPCRFGQCYGFSALPQVDRLLEQYPDPNVSVSKKGRWYVLMPSHPNGVGMAFYPGAAVDPKAYVPLYRKIASEGYLVVIMTVPVGFSSFAPDEARSVIDAYPDVRKWLVGGHSAGGSTASAFARDNPSLVSGIVLNAGGTFVNMTGLGLKLFQSYGS
eukprot:gb/GECH01005205.1/.p1 GENE.gb/GECH01005205.1/~~gb/GECH01005205.1/.p1  ORF type:complete len:305 (+),score=22.00 gb/GECH01005205.1/:1-915(+)